MEKEKLLYKNLTYKIIGLAMEIYNQLGYGFLEKVYENAFVIQLEESNLLYTQQKKFNVLFKNKIVGEFCPDIIVENKVIIEIKTCETIIDAHRSQILNYLKTTSLRVGLIINFSKTKLEYERLIL
ncbi:MAG: GxxExxY protein [Candidatus Sericytochromatia bacterium]